MRISTRLLVASVCALAAGGFTFLLQSNRDFLFENRWHEPYGTFDPREDKNFLSAALALAQEEMRGTTCVGNWIGKDERYVYLTIGCGIFRQEGAKITVRGDQNFRPVRMRINGFELRGAEAADPASFENSVRRLFPRVAAERIETRMNPQIYREQGLAKQLGKAPPPPPAPAVPPPPPIPAK